MPIKTSPSPSFLARTAFMAVLLIGFGVWGGYDLWVKIPHREMIADRYDALTKRLGELDTARQQREKTGQLPTQSEIDEYNHANDELKVLSPGGKTPVRPSKFDRVVQWIYILCLPFAVPSILTLLRIRKQHYELDESGSLHFTGDPEHGSGVWSANDIADIDMSRWMAKSIAWAVKSDGTRLKLDAYVHKNLEQVIGGIACKKHPDQWDAEAKRVKTGEEATSGDDVEADKMERVMSENIAPGTSESGFPGANP